MKKRSVIAAFALALALPSVANDVYDFFKASLRGTATLYAGSRKRLTPREVQQASVEVWKSWLRALKRVEPDTLAHMRRDSMTFAGKWRLPPELEHNATMNFTMLSKGERPTAGYPLRIYLHGSGPRDKEYATGLALTRSWRDAPSVWFVPQIPNEGGYYRWWQRAKVWAWRKLLRKALALGDIDPDRVCLAGISEGAYGTQRLAAFFADYLAGAAALAGGEPLKNAPPQNCANTAFMLLTGGDDTGFYRNALTSLAAAAFDSLAAAHDSLYAHDIRLIPGRGHTIDYSAAAPWLAARVRNPYPRYVAWEDFEMDGCRRNGFHNLLVTERPDQAPEARTFYEETISGDTVSLNVSGVDYTTARRDSVWGLELEFRRRLKPVTRGKVTVFLNRSLVDLNRDITVTVNGSTAFRGKVYENLASMVNSCAAYGDPRRVYTAQVDIDLSARP